MAPYLMFVRRGVIVRRAHTRQCVTLVLVTNWATTHRLLRTPVKVRKEQRMGLGITAMLFQGCHVFSSVYPPRDALIALTRDGHWSQKTYGSRPNIKQDNEQRGILTASSLLANLIADSLDVWVWGLRTSITVLFVR